MKKKVFALFACSVFALSLAVGCGSKETASKTSDPDNPTTGMPAPIAPLTEEEVLEQYEDAADIYADINMGTFDVDTDRTIVKEGYTYYRIHDNRFESYDDLQNYLQCFFTDDFIQAELMDDTLFTEGKDGYLYVLDAGRGANIFYAGHIIGEPVISEDEITLEVTAYYTADETPYEGDTFETAPENTADYKTETYQFRMVPDGYFWKFDDFQMIY